MKFFKAEVNGTIAYVPYNRIDGVQLLIPDTDRYTYTTGNTVELKCASADEVMQWILKVIEQLDSWKEAQSRKGTNEPFPLSSSCLWMDVDVSFTHCGEYLLVTLDDDVAFDFLLNNRILESAKNYDGEHMEAYVSYKVALEQMTFIEGPATSTNAAKIVEKLRAEYDDDGAPDEEGDAIAEQEKQEREAEIQAELDAEATREVMQEEATQDVLDEEARQEAPVEDEEPLNMECLEAFNHSTDKDD